VAPTAVLEGAGLIGHSTPLTASIEGTP